MTLLLISALPILVLLLLGNRLSNKLNVWLGVLSVPFFMLLAFYGVLIFIGISLITAAVWQVRKWILRRRFKKNPVEVMYHTRR